MNENCVMVISVLVFKLCTSNEIIDKFEQSDYKIRNCRADVEHYNKELMQTVDIRTFKYNRTTTAYNATFTSKIDVGRKTQIMSQVYKRASNEYRLFPIRFQVNFCSIFSRNIAGLDDLKRKGNMTTCEWKKGLIYHTYNFMIDETKFPPLMVTGEYKAVVTLTYLEKELFIANAYGEIYRPIKY